MGTCIYDIAFFHSQNSLSLQYQMASKHQAHRQRMYEVDRNDHREDKDNLQTQPH